LSISFVTSILSSTESFWNSVLELATLPSRWWFSSSRNTVWACGASIECGRRGTRRTTPASQGSIRHCLSRNGGARRCEGPGSCLASLTECCGWVWWCTSSYPNSPTTLHAASIFFYLEAHQPYCFFSLYSFSFTLTILIFFVQTQNFKNKRISIEVFKILRILNFSEF